MYKKHYDFLYRQWNVFFVINEQEDYICSFGTAEEAQRFCDYHNLENEVEGRR